MSRRSTRYSRRCPVKSGRRIRSTRWPTFSECPAARSRIAECDSVAQGFGSVSPLVYSAPTQQDWRQTVSNSAGTNMVRIEGQDLKQLRAMLMSDDRPVYLLRVDQRGDTVAFKVNEG